MRRMTLAPIVGIALAIAPINGLHSQPAPTTPAITSQQSEEDRRFLDAYHYMKDHADCIKPDPWAQINLKWAGTPLKDGRALAVVPSGSMTGLYEINPSAGIREKVTEIPRGDGSSYGSTETPSRTLMSTAVYDHQGTILYSIHLEPPSHAEYLIRRIPGINDCALCALADTEYWRRAPRGQPTLETTRKRWEAEQAIKAIPEQRPPILDDAIRRLAEPIPHPVPYLLRKLGF